MKKGFYTVGSIIILIIAAAIFIIAPALVGNGNSQSGISFGSYDGKQIRYEQGSDFANIVAQYADMYSQMGYQVDTSTYYSIFSSAFDQTVQQMAFSDAVKKSGWSVPAQSVNRAMVPYFSDENGEYSPRLYRQADQARVNELRNQIEKSLIINRYYDDVFGSAETVGVDKLFGIKTSAEEIFFINTIGQTMRSFDIVTFDMGKYPDSEKIYYGKGNAQKFVRYDMSVITTSTRRDAESVLRQINNNSITFDDAIGAHSNKMYSNNDGKLSDSYHHQLERVVGASLSSLTTLAVGETSDIIQTGDNFSIFRVDGNAVQPDFDDNDTVRDVFNYLNTYEAGLIEDYYMEIAEHFVSISKEQNFDAACRQIGIEKITLLPFPLNYGSVSIMGTTSTGNAGLSSAGVTERFWEEAFSLEQGGVSNPIVIDNNVVVLKFNETVLLSETDSVAKQEEYVEDSYFSGTENDTTAIVTQLNSYDTSSAQAALMASPKIKNNVMSVFLSEFLSGDTN